ncbi:MAG: DUF58 domain-containing protein [Myxococcaceae bacterium]|nr:DUF58 domain-containing protein [Myxococcaceae bacterium]
MGLGRPLPTNLALIFFGAALVPAVLALVTPGFAFVALALDFAVLGLCGVDFFLAPKARDIRVTRKVEEILSSGVPNRVALEIETTRPVRVHGELRDFVAPGVTVEGHRQHFRIERDDARAVALYRVTPPTRGELCFGDVWLRLSGPLGLCARQVRVPLSQTVKVYPNLTALTREALELARAQEAPAERTIRRASEGSEFESLREYREGDDFRTIDWKATARRARMMVRVHQPERNQPVLIFLDCGRHMAGVVGGRRKLDHAVDAALRLAKVSLDEGDLVGVVAFAREVKLFLPPRKGGEHLRTLTAGLFGIEAALEESAFGKALDFAFARHHRRTLVVLFTDLQDPETSGTLLTRTLALRPRHLPLVVSLLDEDLERAAHDEPIDVQAAYVRHAAARLEDDYRRTTAQLRNAGALALRAPPGRFGAAAVNEYLRVKARGLL